MVLIECRFQQCGRVLLCCFHLVTETDFMKEAIEAKCLHQAMVLVLPEKANRAY